MQSGVLVALRYVADNGDEFLENFYLRGVRTVERGQNEAPHAYVIPRDQARPIATDNLVDLLIQEGLEIHVADEKLSWSGEGDEEHEAPEGSYVIRLDQPYGVLARVLLDVQNFPEGERPPYDDTGWTLPYLHNVESYSVGDASILSAEMSRVTEAQRAAGRMDGKGRNFYLVNNTTDDNFTALRFTLSDVRMDAAEASFESGGDDYNAGSFIIAEEGNPEDLGDRLEAAAAELGLEVQGVGRRPDVASHEVEVPRVALMHSWTSTQDEGWWRYAFDEIGIPYTYISTQDLAGTDLSSFDVIVMPRTRGNSRTLVTGTTVAGPPIPWRNSAEYSAIGLLDETDDVRRGMGYDGLASLQEFIAGGGVFITEGATAALPIDMGITRRVSIRTTSELLVRGSVLRAEVTDESSPIVYGYAESLPVYFSQAPVFQVSGDVSSPFTPDWMEDELYEKEIPRVVLSFAKEDILMSGMLRGERELAGAPAVVDAPVGEGHVILFANRPFWRWETRGSHALVFNTMLHWNDLRTGWPTRPGVEEESAVADEVQQ
jgi:hypothetical protein